MTVPVVSRSDWGATPWESKPHSEKDENRTAFFVHYHGGKPPTSKGMGVPRNAEKIHLDNGWSGIGYNFVVDQAGVAYEGRGWSLVGAHCPGWNRKAWGVYLAVGEGQEPSDAALATIRALYDEACERSGRKLAKRGHRDGKATACPGEALYAWVKRGMPSPLAPLKKPVVETTAPALQTPEEDDVCKCSVIVKDPAGPKQYVTDFLTKRHITQSARKLLLARGVEYIGEALSAADLAAIPEVQA